MKLSLEDPAYVNEMKAVWRATPLCMTVLEFHGTGDPFFGGKADDRPLGKNGQILERGYRREDVATFETVEQAHEAAKRVPNRRKGSCLGVLPSWR